MQSFFSIGVLFPSFPVWVSNPNQIPPTPFIRGSPGIQTQVTKENRRWRKQKQKSLAEVHPGDHPAGLGSKRPHTHPDPTPKKMGPWVFWGHFFVSHFESRCEKVFFFMAWRSKKSWWYGGCLSSWYRCFSRPSLVWSPRDWSFPIWVSSKK